MSRATELLKKYPIEEAPKSKLDDEINTLYKKHGNGVQVGVMDLSKIFKAGKDAAAAGTSVEDAIIAAIAKYRVN